MQSVNTVTVRKYRIVNHRSERGGAMNRQPLHRARSIVLNTTIHFDFRLHVWLQVIIFRTSAATLILRISTVHLRKVNQVSLPVRSVCPSPDTDAKRAASGQRRPEQELHLPREPGRIRISPPTVCSCVVLGRSLT